MFKISTIIFCLLIMISCKSFDAGINDDLKSFVKDMVENPLKVDSIDIYYHGLYKMEYISKNFLELKYRHKILLFIQNVFTYEQGRATMYNMGGFNMRDPLDESEFNYPKQQMVTKS